MKEAACNMTNKSNDDQSINATFVYSEVPSYFMRFAIFRQGNKIFQKIDNIVMEKTFHVD